MQYKSATQRVMLWNTTVGIKENIKPERREGEKFFLPAYRLIGKQMVWRPKGRTDQKKLRKCGVWNLFTEIHTSVFI